MDYKGRDWPLANGQDAQHLGHICLTFLVMSVSASQSTVSLPFFPATHCGAHIPPLESAAQLP